jgi:hypothetical protein
MQEEPDLFDQPVSRLPAIHELINRMNKLTLKARKLHNVGKQRAALICLKKAADEIEAKSLDPLFVSNQAVRSIGCELRQLREDILEVLRAA